MTSDVRVRRAYDSPEPGDGTRVLVDRLWPRGLRRDEAALDEWCRAVAPSAELRRWYGHDPERFEEFARRYRAELAGGEQAAGLAHLRDLAGRGPITLLTASRRADISDATVLAALLRDGDRHDSHRRRRDAGGAADAATPEDPDQGEAIGSPDPP